MPRPSLTAALARLAELRPVYGVLKLFLEVTLPLARLAKRGEVIRVGISPKQTPPGSPRGGCAPSPDDA